MKILILASSANSIYLASQFVDLEASVTLWSELNPLELVEKYPSSDFNAMEHLQNLRSKIIYKNNPIKFIKKSFIHLDENYENKSRMIDTFDIIYTKDEINHFETFDFVFDERILQEKESSEVHVENIDRVQNLFASKLKENSLLLLESDKDLDLLNENLKNVFIVPLNNEIRNSEKVLDAKERFDLNFEKEVIAFKENKENGEPVRKVEFLLDFSLVGFNKFDDVDGGFAVCEAPTFRVKLRENRKVFKVDHIVHFGQKRQYRDKTLIINSPEDGYYHFNGEGDIRNFFTRSKNHMLTFFKRA